MPSVTGALSGPPPSPESAPQAEGYKRRIDAYRYVINTLGRDIAQSTFYSHCSKGVVARDPQTGLYTENLLNAYAAKHIRGDETRSSSLQDQKLRAQIAAAEAQARRLSIQADRDENLVIPRADAEAFFAARLRALMAAIDQWFAQYMIELIVLVDGNPDKAAEALAWSEEHKASWFDRYARDGKITLDGRDAS